MINIERILCPVNLPPVKDGALGYAVGLARAFHANLFLCHCENAPALISIGVAHPAHDQPKKILADWLARYVNGAHRDEFEWKVVVLECDGDAGEAIVREACARHADLIVMCSRRSRLRELLGSTAEQVSRTASCPVLVIHPQEHVTNGKRNGKQKGAGRFRRVLVSHDFSTASELAFSYALAIAQQFRAELHLMHVLPEPDWDEPQLAWPEVGVETVYQRALRRLNASVPEEVYECCKVISIVRWGKPYREVLAYSREHDMDLVCIGAQGRDFGLEALFGSNADRVLRQAPCSVLIARPLKPATFSSLVLRAGRAVS